MNVPPLILAIVLRMCHAQSDNTTTGTGFQFQLIAHFGHQLRIYEEVGNVWADSPLAPLGMKTLLVMTYYIP